MQRTLLLTGTATDFGGNVLGNAPCTFQPILPGVSGAMIDGLGEFVSMAPVAFRTNPDGTFPTLTVDYPGDFQTAYQNAQVRVTVNGVVTDSPIGFGYASSIDFTTWINATVATGLVVMRAVYTKDDGTPLAGATGSVSLSDSALVTATGQFRSSNNPVQSVAATDGTMTFSLDPNSALTPTDLGYILQISGEPRSWQFTVPAVVDVYRGAWSNTTTYHGASGSSNGDVVLDSGVLYRYINATPSSGHATSDATRWSAVVGLPTDLIAAHLTLIGPSNGTIIGTTGVAASPNLATTAADPHNPATSLDDDLVDLAFRDTLRLRNMGAWSGSTAYAVNDAVQLSSIWYVCILAHTNHTPPNVTYWQVVGGGGGGGSSAFSWATITANHLVTTADSGIAIDATSGNIIVTLPTAVGITQQFAFKRVDSSVNVVSFVTAGLETIDGAGSPLFLTVADQVLVIGSNNVNWLKVSALYPNPLTSIGDIVVGGASGLPTRLPIGLPGQSLQVAGGTVVYATPRVAQPVILSVSAGVPDFVVLGADIVVL